MEVMTVEGVYDYLMYIGETSKEFNVGAYLRNWFFMLP